MSFERVKQTTSTLAFRLTFYYAGLFTLSTVTALLVIYLLTSAVLKKNLDEDLLGEIHEYSTLLEKESLALLLYELENEAADEDPDEFFFRLISQQGEEILTSDLEPWIGLEPPTELVTTIETQQRPFLTTKEFSGRGDSVRVVNAKLAPGYYFQLAEASPENQEILEIIVTVFTWIILPILLLGGLSGWHMARRALAGVAEVTETACRIASGDFSHRVPLKSRGQEIELLATTFNSMLDRIHSLITGLREVTDNLAHDLRSPITSIRGTAETTLINSEELGDYKNMAGNTIEECDRLLAMVNSILDISEAEAGAEQLQLRDTDLTVVAQQACELFQPIAEERNLSLSLAAPLPCVIPADTKKIQRLIANLLDNALKYTPSGGSVVVRVQSDDNNIEVHVEDNGIGISEADVSQIFQRFYRCDQSRSQTGTGLGLCLAKVVAKAHGGKIHVESQLGKGSSFILFLPKPTRNA